MAAFAPVITKALGNIGIDAQRLAGAQEGAVLYGEGGVLDSLDFVRFISELTQLLDGMPIDLFELVEELDGNLPNAFASIKALSDHLGTLLSEVTA